MKHLLTGFVMALGVGSMALPASANIFSFDTDTQFFDFGFGKLGGGNVRWGAGGGAQTWEFAIVNGGDIPTAGSEKNRNWVSGEDNIHEAVFGYDAGGAASLDIEAASGASTGTIATGANTLLIRARANPNDGQAASLSSLVVTLDNGEEIILAGVTGDNDAQYIGLFDPRLSNGFSVAGQGLINGGENPRGSSPAYQFKVGLSNGVQEIPVPGTLALLGGGLLGFGLLTRRRRSGV
jgi:hypothetical protein